MYVRARTLDEAVQALETPDVQILAGGTDFYPAHVGRTVTVPVLDITGIGEIAGIATTADHVRIGAGATWSQLIATPLPACFDALKAAAREVGSVQIQNRGTIAGNLCNASPAADGVPPLLALDAEVELPSPRGRAPPAARQIHHRQPQDRAQRRRDPLRHHRAADDRRAARPSSSSARGAIW